MLAKFSFFDFLFSPVRFNLSGLFLRGFVDVGVLVDGFNLDVCDWSGVEFVGFNLDAREFNVDIDKSDVSIVGFDSDLDGIDFDVVGFDSELFLVIAVFDFEIIDTFRLFLTLAEA